MMNQLQKGLIFALIQVAFVSSLGAKLLWDRSRLPRGWSAIQGYDPDLPIRGRYMSFTLLVNADRIFSEAAQSQQHPPAATGPWNVYLTVENGQIVANPADHFTGLTVAGPTARQGQILAALMPPVVYFLPEHATDPLRGHRPGTLVLEATIPRTAPPRPIRLGVQVDGHIVPLGAN
jgi:hypothetical protein